MIELFRKSGRSGFYFSVVREGELRQDDPIQLVSKSSYGISIADVNRLHMEPANTELLERLLAVPDLSPAQRKHFEKRGLKASPHAIGEIGDSVPAPTRDPPDGQKSS
jgi:MOSC domain-containing protein YiiM